MMVLAPSLLVQLISCTAACVGFAYWFNVKGIQVMYAGIGAFLTWLVYALLYNAGYGNFLATLAGSVFVATYAQVMARCNYFSDNMCIPACAGTKPVLYDVLHRNEKT